MRRKLEGFKSHKGFMLDHLNLLDDCFFSSLCPNKEPQKDLLISQNDADSF